MASVILPIAFHANPWVGAALAIAGSLIDRTIISALTPATVTERGKLDDVDYQTATLGANISKGYGTCKVVGNIIWGTKFTEHVKTETSGGKGGGSKQETKTYSYTVSFAVAICEGVISGITKVYADGNEFNLSDYADQYNLYTGTESQEPDEFMESIEGVGNVSANRGIAYIVFKNLDVTNFGTRIPSFAFVVTYPKNAVQDIVRDICNDAGLVETLDFNVDELAGLTVQGFNRTGGTTGKEQVDNLRMCFVFDGAERRGLVEFTKRDFTNVISINKNDYGAFENDPESEPIQTTESNDLSLPKTINLSYTSSDNDYQTGSQPASRQVSAAIDEKSVSTDVVLSDAAAKEIAELRLYEAWIARTTHKFKVGSKYGWVLPGDIIELEMPDSTRQLVIATYTSYGQPGINQIKAANVYSGTYTIATRSVDPAPTPIVTTPTDIYWAILDIPKLPPDTNSGDNYVYFVSGAVNYLGANVYRSDDSGASYYLDLQNNYDGLIGSAQTVLGDGKTYTWDNLNTVDVYMPYGTLASHTKEEVLNYYNGALLGNEIIQFRYATLIGEKTYRLSGLLRGRFGTEQYTGTHKAGEAFVMLDKSTINSIPISQADWYSGIPFKIAPRSKSILSPMAQSTTFTPQAVMFRPWSGCHLNAVQIDGVWNVSWVRRTRKDGDLKDYADVPLNESYEAYDVDIINASGEVIKTLNCSTPEFTYTGECAGANIYQISETRGRGFQLEWRN